MIIRGVGDDGLVIWVERAFGRFFGSLMGSWKFLSGFINIATFPILCMDYLERIIHTLEFSWPRQISILTSTLILSFVNYTRLAIVGWGAVLLGLVSCLPFFIMSLMAIPKIQPHRWINLSQRGVKRDWNIFFNTHFWNLNFWDNVITLAGEVDNPQKTFSGALLVALVFTCLAYLVPLFAVIRAVLVDQSEWGTRFHANGTELIAGNWLKVWIEVGVVLSTIGLFEAKRSNCAYQLEGMANLAIMPKFFACISKRFNTPWVGILLSTLITIEMSYMEDIISSTKFLYSLGMLMEFAELLYWVQRALVLPSGRGRRGNASFWGKG